MVPRDNAPIRVVSCVFIGGIMSNIEQQLAELSQTTLEKLKEIQHQGEKELQDLRVAVLGKKGP